MSLGYVGSRGVGLLATNTISTYPEGAARACAGGAPARFMPSPTAGQTLETTITGTTQQMGLLQYQYPYYGRVQVSGLPLGTVEIQRHDRACGAAVQSRAFDSRELHFGKLMDDVGGADGQGGKTVQSFDSYKAAWGLSPLDRKHRFNMSYVYEFPFGNGRKWLGSP